MTTFELAKQNYDRGLWTAEMLEALAGKGRLTLDEVREITAGAAC